MRLTRTTLILLIANAVCAGLLWQSLPDATTVANRTLAFPIAPAWVEVESSKGTLRLERAEGGWRVTSPYRWTANPWEVQRLLGELALIRETPERTGRLATGERWKVRAAAEAGETIEASVLAESLPGGGQVAYLDGGKRGAATAGEPLIKALAQPAEAFRLNAVFTLAPFEIRNVGVRRILPSGEERRWGLVLEARETIGRAEPKPLWRFEAPDVVTGDPERLPKALTTLTEVRAVRFIEKRTQADTKPWLRISLESASRREVVLLWAPVEGFSEAILEDNPDQPFMMDARAVAAWSDPIVELRSRIPFDFDAAGARGLVLTQLREGRSLTLHRLEGSGADGRWEMPVVAGSTVTRRRDVSVGRAQQLLRILTGLRVGETQVAPKNLEWKRLDIDFTSGRLTYELAHEPERKLLWVRTVGGEAQACSTDLPFVRWLSLDANDWRSEVLTRLPEGSSVVGVELKAFEGDKLVAKALLGSDSRWTAEGKINDRQAALLATQLAVVQASSFKPETLTVATPEPRWLFTLRVMDQAAAGAAGIAVTERRYDVARAEGPGSLRMRDTSDGTIFIPSPNLAEALAPWTSP